LKLLLDMCMPVGLVASLTGAGHDVVHVRSLDPRASDEWIIGRARDESRIAVTMDLDFGDIMSHIRESTPSVVLLRLRHPTPDRVLARLKAVLGDHRAALESGSIIIVEDQRSRVRRLPIVTE
jgi:predicted nuclease of predicted toxin-antitoxin system